MKVPENEGSLSAHHVPRTRQGLCGLSSHPAPVPRGPHGSPAAFLSSHPKPLPASSSPGHPAPDARTPLPSGNVLLTADAQADPVQCPMKRELGFALPLHIRIAQHGAQPIASHWRTFL